jgi:hypothetical protein
MGLPLVTCSFHALALYSFRHIVMLLGLVIPLTVVLFLPIAFFLVVPSLLGSKQVAVSRLTTKAELCVMALVTTEVTWLGWLGWLLEGFGVSASISTHLLSDSTVTINIARDPIKHELTKYIGVDVYFTRSQV